MTEQFACNRADIELFFVTLQRGVDLITPIKRTTKQRLVKLDNKLLLRKYTGIETITDQLKNISQIERSHHRSPTNFLVNVLAGVLAYCHQPKKPSLQATPDVLALLGQ